MVKVTVPEVEIELEAEKVADLFEQEFSGWCPVCKYERIEAGAVICDTCYAQAQEWRGES